MKIKKERKKLRYIVKIILDNIRYIVYYININTIHSKKKGDIRMFNNLHAEMARKKISQTQLADMLKLSTKTISNKMTGKSEFTRKEMFQIKKEYFNEYSIDYLFNDFNQPQQTA